MGHWSFPPLSTYRAYREKKKVTPPTLTHTGEALLPEQANVLPTVGEGRRTCHR